MEISYTRYRVYRECPWKYKLHFVDGRKIPHGPKSSFGLSLHRAIEAWSGGGDDSLDALLDALDAQWNDYGYADEAEEARWRQKAERALRRFHESEQGRRARVIGSEKEFVWELGAHVVRGMIDRIEQRPDGAYELLDYKTSPEPPAPERVACDQQLRFYALGMKRGLGLTPAFLSVDAVLAGERVTVPYDPSGEDALAADIAAAAAGISSEAFIADTRHCPRCPFNKDCIYSAVR